MEVQDSKAPSLRAGRRMDARHRAAALPLFEAAIHCTRPAAWGSHENGKGAGKPYAQ